MYSSILFSLLVGLDIMSVPLYFLGFLRDNILSEFNRSAVVFFPTIICCIQGCLIGYKTKSSLFILPTVFLVWNSFLILSILSTADDNLQIDLSDELLWLGSFGFCPFVDLLTPLQTALVKYNYLGPIISRYLIWCFQYTFLIWLYFVGLLYCTKRIYIWLFEHHQHPSKT